MAGEEPLKPECYENLAQSYAELIRVGEKTLEDVPNRPAKLKPRVVYLVEHEETESA